MQIIDDTAARLILKEAGAKTVWITNDAAQVSFEKKVTIVRETGETYAQTVDRLLEEMRA